MPRPCYADISFFDTVCHSGAGSFVWNADAKSGKYGNLFGWLPKKKNDTSKTKGASESSSNGKNEKVSGASLAKESSSDLHAKGMAKSKSRLSNAWKAALAVPLLLPMAGTLETGITHLTNPVEARQRFEDQSGWQNARDFTFYNDLYQRALHDRGWLRFFDFLRRAVEAGITGDRLTELLSATLEHRKNKKNAEKGGTKYEKKAKNVSADEYMLATDLQDAFAQKEAVYEKQLLEQQQTIAQLQKNIEQLQRKLGDTTKKSLFADTPDRILRGLY